MSSNDSIRAVSNFRELPLLMTMSTILPLYYLGSVIMATVSNS